jgi:hypothetical protein
VDLGYPIEYLDAVLVFEALLKKQSSAGLSRTLFLLKALVDSGLCCSVCFVQF